MRIRKIDPQPPSDPQSSLPPKKPLLPFPPQQHKIRMIKIRLPQSFPPPLTPLSQCVAAKSLILFLLILITMYHMLVGLSDFLFFIIIKSFFA